MEEGCLMPNPAACTGGSLSSWNSAPTNAAGGGRAGNERKRMNGLLSPFLMPGESNLSL